MKKTILLIIITALSNPAMASISEIVLENEVTKESLKKIGDRSFLESYASINKNWKYAMKSSEFKTTSNLWKPTNVIFTENIKTKYFRWKYETETDIDLALSSILSSETSAECMNAVKLAKIRLISNVLGQELMKNLVTIIKKQYNNSDYNFFHALSWAFQTPCDKNFKGVYSLAFVNISEYMDFMPQGDCGNHNVIRLSNGTFMGFDSDFFMTPKTYDEFEKYMYYAFMSGEFVKKDKLEEYQKFCSRLSFEGYKEKRRLYQARFKPYRFDVKKIMLFIRTGKY